MAWVPIGTRESDTDVRRAAATGYRTDGEHRRPEAMLRRHTGRHQPPLSRRRMQTE